MNGKIRQRGTLAIIIYFLMITAIWTPIGFYAGRARGETETRAATGHDQNMSQFETGTHAEGAGKDVQHFYAPIVFLPDQSEPIRGASSHNRAPRAVRRDASLRQNPLREAVLRALANDAAAGSVSGDASQQPFSLAMAPDLSTLGGDVPIGGLLGNAGGGQGSTLGGSAPGGNGYPGAIIPGFLISASTPPGGEPPVLATPIPAALPMFLSGLAACWAAARRKRSR